MRNTMKAAAIESKFPLLAVEHDCIISKDADITVAFRVDLPELFTVTSAEYEAIHSSWAKAIKVLPDYSVIQKQDWFTKENYKPETDKEDMSFLSRSFERHFQRTSVPESYLFPLPDKDNERTPAYAVELFKPLPGQYHSEGSR